MTSHQREVLRYVVNGIAATAVHYMVLYTCLELLGMKSAGLANVIASSAGISASFAGNRYFVFPGQRTAFFTQATKFAGLYISIALVNGAILLVWTDVFGLNYSIGFLIGVAVQVLVGYVGARKHVFTPAAGVEAVAPLSQRAGD
ncbi:MAG: GtrA family protein [Pseudomonadota bacterium]